MAPQLSPTRVLVIDDDGMSRELLALLLETDGYSVSSAESGDAALDLLDAGPIRPDIILTDMQMPGSTPGQLAGRLRRACGRNTFLLAMSGSRPSQATIARYDGFLLKPFTTAELTTAIQAARAPRTAAPAAIRPTVPAMLARPSRIATKTAPDRFPATVDLAASASQPASNHRMVATSRSAPPALPHADAPPVLDENIYRQLAGSMPAPQLHEMYAMCVSDARARIASMRSLAAARDAAQFMRQAHTIKGSCGMLGATELHRIAAALEKPGHDIESAAVNSLDELSAACDRLERMLGARA